MAALAPFSLNSVGDSAGRFLVYVSVSWADVEDAGPGAYNEAFLAAFRRDLKAQESADKSKGVIITPVLTVPTWAVTLSRSEQEQHFIAACIHAARRIKDCAIVRGFRLSGFDAPLAAAIKTGLAPKHPAYEYW
jgi:hypothetical protein